MATTLANINIKDNSSWNTYLNLIYPIGSYYISNTSTSPSSRFGGSWSQVTGRVLYCNSSVGNYNAQTHTHSGTSLFGKLNSDHGTIRWSYSSTSTYNTNWEAGDYNSNYGANTKQQTQGLNIFGNTGSTTNGLPARRDVYCWYRTA